MPDGVAKDEFEIMEKKVIWDIIDERFSSVDKARKDLNDGGW